MSDSNCEKRRIRVGKTKRDRDNGAAARNAQNKAARVVWRNDPNEKVFPIGTCNGKRTRALRKAAKK